MIGWRRCHSHDLQFVLELACVSVCLSVCVCVCAFTKTVYDADDTVSRNCVAYCFTASTGMNTV